MVHRNKEYICKNNSFQSHILNGAHFASLLQAVLGLFERILGLILLSWLLIFLFWSAVKLLSYDGQFFITVMSNLVKKVPIFLKFDHLKWAPFLEGEFTCSQLCLLILFWLPLIYVNLHNNNFYLLLKSLNQWLVYCLGVFFLNSSSTFTNLTVFKMLGFLSKNDHFQENNFSLI